MGLTYDGITYRSLEEQVRYDAEQVQLLKQADVTINENLQTVNTELSSKLDKPANPSAESAVTMLADGTVNTKPLSELGGKLYRHELHCNITGISGIGDIYIYVINTSQDAITNITSLPLGYYTTYFYQYQKYGFGYIYIRVTGHITMSYVAINDENNNAIFGAEKIITISTISDTVTEV